MERREIKKKARSGGEQSEICLSCWCLPSDFFLDPLWVFCSSRSYCPTLEKNKSLLLILKLPTQFSGLLGFCRQRGAGLHFLPFLQFGKDGVSVWAAIITGA